MLKLCLMIQSLVFAQAAPRGEAGSATFQPNPVWHGHSLRIVYDQQTGPLHGAAQIFAHVGYDNWESVVEPDTQMFFTGVPGVYDVIVGVSGDVQVDVAFHDGNDMWDNNGGADWHAPIIYSQGGWLMDGQLDASAEQLAQNGSLTLHAGFVADKLYVAAADAGEGNDHFIFVASPPGTMRPAPWAKTGQVADWAAFLADENDNDFAGWFDAIPGTGTQSWARGNGGWFEGSVRLDQLFGQTPDSVWIAFAPFATNDGGELINAAQCPAGVNGNGNVEAIEFVEYVIYPPGDMNHDRSADENDVGLFTDVLVGGNTAPEMISRADLDGDGRADGEDIEPFVAGLIE